MLKKSLFLLACVSSLSADPIVFKHNKACKEKLNRLLELSKKIVEIEEHFEKLGVLARPAMEVVGTKGGQDKIEKTIEKTLVKIEKQDVAGIMTEGFLPIQHHQVDVEGCLGSLQQTVVRMALTRALEQALLTEYEACLKDYLKQCSQAA